MVHASGCRRLDAPERPCPGGDVPGTEEPLVKLRTGSKAGAVALLTAALVAAGCSSGSSGGSSSPGTSSSGSAAPSSGSAASSRGFDGHTIKVAGISELSNFAGAEIGSEARFKRANDTNELNGIKIQFQEMANSNFDPATALSEVRRLVTQDQVFAIVPDLSAENPGPYLAQQQVPYLGYGFDTSYCSPTPSTSVWGFGYNGCLVPTNPPKMPDSFSNLYKYVSGKTGKQHPTMALFSSDIQSGKDATKFQASAAQGAGFNVVYAKGVFPTVTSDYTPYVQQWLRAAGGKAPDTLTCLAATQCIQIWQAVQAAGYQGTFYHTLGNVDALAKVFAGTYTAAFYNTDTASNPGLAQMQADFQAFKPGTALTGYSNVPAYFAADMFIQAVKKVGRNITPQAVQKALSTITWQIPGFVGPTVYPSSTAVPTPACTELLADPPGGSGYQIVEPFSCSNRQISIDPNFTG
jgi:ABC-type branched-subunit amino acid transport system substrate-binding protein